jgi:elongation factor G
MLRHEAPDVGAVQARLGLGDAASAVAVIDTRHTTHGGKLSVGRVIAGEVVDGAQLTGPGTEERVAGVFTLRGAQTSKRPAAQAGDLVAFGRLEYAATGDMLTANKIRLDRLAGLDAPAPVHGVAIALEDRKDEVKLTAALHKLAEEDDGLRFMNDGETHQMILAGTGEMHLRVAIERLARKFGVRVQRARRQVPYKETIRKPTKVRGRHKKQSGGHGQFGDVVVEILPQPRGAGFHFSEAIVGGSVPRQFVPSVEIGVVDALKQGPLGFPVVDCAVRLVDGSYHSVDSSDMAFRQAARIAMQDGLPACQPVLLEPIHHVEICIPSEATPRINALIAQRRGQILGFDAREGWPGWDCVTVHLPEAEMEDLIVEVRSATQGVGTFHARFDHLAELTGKLAEGVLQGHRQAAE